MTLLSAVLMGWSLIAHDRRTRRSLVAISAVALSPPVGLVAVVGTWLLRRRIGRPGIRRRQKVDDLATARVAQLSVVGLASGFTIEHALSFCAERGPEAARPQLRRVLRSARPGGLAAAAEYERGPLRPLLVAIASGIRSGAPLQMVLRTHADQALANHAAKRIARARRLPAKLAMPLALLVLPGFVVMVMGPTVLALARRMLGPIAGFP